MRWTRWDKRDGRNKMGRMRLVGYKEQDKMNGIEEVINN